MRLRLGGSVIVLGRKQLAVVGLLVTLALVGVRFIVSDVTGVDDEDAARPVLIDDVLRQRRRADPGRADVDPAAAAAAGQQGWGLADRRMAMDEARARRGTGIDAARQRLITGQRRAPDSRYNINVTCSDLTSPDRDVLDTRPRICLSFPCYAADKQLPTATVIIPFYNEALTMLLRAVHSVLNKSPDRLLDEVYSPTTRACYVFCIVKRVVCFVKKTAQKCEKWEFCSFVCNESSHLCAILCRDICPFATCTVLKGHWRCLFSFFFWLRVLDKAEYSAFESTLNSPIVSYRLVSSTG